MYVPPYLSQCIWKSLENIDRVIAYNLAYHTLVALHQNATIKKGYESQFYNALCSLYRNRLNRIMNWLEKNAIKQCTVSF